MLIYWRETDVLASLILAVAMTGQGPKDFVGPPDLRRMTAIVAPRSQAINPTLAKRRARKLAAARDDLRREAQHRATQAAQLEAHRQEQARMERMAPLMLEAQRQAILRQNAMERNAIDARNAATYERMAGAAERRSGLYTQQNSAVRPQTPQAPPHLQGSPLDQ